MRVWIAEQFCFPVVLPRGKPMTLIVKAEGGLEAGARGQAEGEAQYLPGRVGRDGPSLCCDLPDG